MKPTTSQLDDNMAFAAAHEDPFVRAYLIPDYAASHEYRSVAQLAAHVAPGLRGPVSDPLPTMLVIVEEPRTADMWWEWHAADSARWSSSLEEDEERCASWVAGESDDGPFEDEEASS